MSSNFKIIRRALNFYGKCISWAAKGTLGRANATYGVVGAAIIYLAGLVFDRGILMIPSDAPSNILFIIIAVMTSWCAIFAVRVLIAPGKIYGDAEDNISTLTERAMPKLKVALINGLSGVQVVKTQTNTQPGPLSKWLQVIVECATDIPLNDCTVHVTKVKKINENAAPTELLFEPVLCKWSQLNSNEKRIKISPMIPQAANLFSILDVSPPQINLEFHHTKYQLDEALQNPGKFQIEVVVSADNTTPIRAKYLLIWNGDFETIDLVPE